MNSTLTFSELEALAYDIGVDIEPRQIRMTSKPAPADAVNGLRALASEYGEDGRENGAPQRSATVRELRRLAATGELSAHELRTQLRGVGIDLGDAAEDDADRRHTALHESAHAACALSLGWAVNWIDLARGQTKVSQPSYESRGGVNGMDLERAVIAAAGGVFAGTDSQRVELSGDRAIVRQHRTGWEDARRGAEKMAKERWVKSLHEALTEALLASPNGRLEGRALGAVIEDWEAEWPA